MTSVVADSACLIGLERIEALSILRDTVAEILIPQVVHAEWDRTVPWILVAQVQNQRVAEALATQVDPGEAEAIALAAERGVAVLLDDKKARRVAKQMGIKVIGTVGLLLRAKRQGVLPAVKPVIDRLLQVGFRIAPSLYDEALHMAGEAQP